ncbi:RagB/SusD family nutrient uptake outer membrane protein [Segatella bryantii]|uniref:RagB/SusD family nutrient uptake outer membrane protein n=1 Tax=Segatella bryantii TaxID=77095 RepID=A0ABX4EK65_SEGBR|nr:RagB/SusD family nutrient uptake outer membrane protein [Segatella bryantii]MDR4930159.1 RagB/SusD family nutrient uptake outer membrane protein [Segatella bryantii]OYP55922.1 RagB/SusD family nutrient uptake outer membrane protein [Segatella bryantii]UKK81152.1 RagB/SusD family nutrient uptake outer membrane protein [Segatella bryantii]
MKLYNISLAMLLGISTLTSCSDKLNVENPNEQTTANFGVDELEENVVAAYNHIRMEGSYARVGYMIDVTRGDEVWNSSQVWYMPFDDYNLPEDGDIGWWIWREWYYTINVCNFGLSKCGDDDTVLSESMKRIKGQFLFLRGLAYYNLAGYFQNPPLITDYSTYSTLDGLYAKNSSYDEVLDQVEKDLAEAMTLLPSRDAGGEWAKGRATCGAAAGYYARALMQRHKYSEALTVLKDIINKKYGTYKLMANYGDNFREGSQYENNDESLFEIQFLDYGSQGTDDEWTPVNTSKNATQGSAVESNFCPGVYGGWADLSASPWLYNLFKAERTTAGKLDPRLYWTIGTYEADWEGFEYGNVGYTVPMTATDTIMTNNTNGGLPIAKNTNMRTGLYSSVATGLHDGINLRMMRYSDVLLRAAECENEVNGPTQQAIDWINQVRERANLADLNLTDFDTKDKLFEQIANVERPKEFGCEFGRGFDLIRWGFFLTSDRQQQLKEHETFRRSLHRAKDPVSYAQVGIDSELKCSFDTYVQGHEFIPIVQTLMNSNPNLVGNSANNSESNKSYFEQKGWTVHPVVDLSK